MWWNHQRGTRFAFAQVTGCAGCVGVCDRCQAGPRWRAAPGGGGEAEEAVVTSTDHRVVVEDLPRPPEDQLNDIGQEMLELKKGPLWPAQPSALKKALDAVIR